MSGTNNDEMSLKDFLSTLKAISKYIFSKWKVIVVLVIVGFCAGYGYAKYKKKLFIADTSFVLDDGDMSNGLLGQYSGLASLAGIDISNLGGGIFQGDNILALYKSDNMIKRTLLSSPEKNGPQLIEYYLKINKTRERWTNPKLKALKFDDSNANLRLRDSVMNNVIEDIKKNYLSISKPDKKSSILQVETKSTNEEFSKIFNTQIVKTVNDYYIETKSRKSLQNFAILKRQNDSVRNVLNQAIYKNVSVVDATPNLNPARQVLRVPAQHSQIDIEADKAMLAQLVQNLEVAKITLRRETPLIQIIDESTYPLKVQRVSTIVATVAGGFIVGLLCVFYFGLSFLLNRIK